MRSTTLLSVAAAALLAGTAHAHNKVTHFHVNGAAETKCVRQAVSTDPISGLSSPAMACNIVSSNTPEKCTVAAGDEVAFEYRAEPDKAPEQVALKDGRIKVGVTDDSHKGPCAVYAKKVDDASSAVGEGDGWFKLSHDGVENNEFCTTRLNNADAPLKATIPTSLAPGDYLLRAEILTLNNVGENDPQFYPGCVQVTITGGDGSAQPETVSIPGHVDMSMPGLNFDIWNTEDYSGYEIPGPAPMSEGGAGEGVKPPANENPTPAPEPETPVSDTPVEGGDLETPEGGADSSEGGDDQKWSEGGDEGQSSDGGNDGEWNGGNDPAPQPTAPLPTTMIYVTVTKTHYPTATEAPVEEEEAEASGKPWGKWPGEEKWGIPEEGMRGGRWSRM